MTAENDHAHDHAHDATKHWTSQIMTPVSTLTPEQRLPLLAAIASGLTLVWLTGETIAVYPDIFYTGPLGAGQLTGFFFAYFFIIFYVLAHFTQARRAFSELTLQGVAAGAEFGAYMLLFYFCDRTTIVPRAKKHYDRGTFWGLWALLIAAGLCTLRRAKPPAAVPATAAIEDPEQAALAPTAPNEDFHVKHLQRDQTEEWKGWMQVMFLWYHYFNAGEIYNVIRLYIAAYVWMTGFGNFSYYYIRKDFSFTRFFQMQWRLNFMVVWVCAILNNEYMLYYICMLHTTFTVMIYVGLGVYNHINSSTVGVAIKVVALTAVSAVVWDVQGVFEAVWAPLTWLVQYHDPYRPQRDIMSEWKFRSYLDHLIWIIGMLCAYSHPRIDGWLVAIDAMPAARRNAIKAAVVAAVLAIGYVYTVNVFLLPKAAYNALHPFTSFIPLLLFVVLRNISTRARQYHMHLFEFLGKTTLETYIAQFHIWMATTGVNGSPKRLLNILPGDMPILNFVVTSVLFFSISYRLFTATNVLKGFVLPNKVPEGVIKRNVVLTAWIVAAAYVACAVMRMFSGSALAQAPAPVPPAA